ncbi:hypothetical protein FRC17_005118 [Serendipita sp. 399]|nr:hypothetical protein FRC17_005118 [Serendipita sp. 399]
MQICATSPHLDDALARARSAPLDVILSLPTNMLREQPPRELASMYHKLFGEQEICARIAKLTIPELPLPLVLDMGTFLPHSTRAPSFPMLRELIYRNTAGKAWHSVVAQMISSSHGLRSLDVSAYLLDKTKHSGIWDPDVWGKLHHLRVNASGWTRVGLRSLDIIVPWSRSIKELVITDILWPIVETPDRITFPNLRQAKLWSTSKGLALIHAPLLESLEVRLLSVNADGDNHRLDMPALRTITVSGNVQRWIYKSNLPNLHSLTVLKQDFYNENSTPTSEVFVPGGLPSVQEATFKGSCGGGFQIAALESVPNAQRITIIQTPFVQPPATPQLSRSLVWRLSAKGSSLLSPHARRIQLGEPQFGFQAPDDALDRLLDKIVEVRRQRGCPLESLSVYWHRFLGPSEYVSL